MMTGVVVTLGRVSEERMEGGEMALLAVTFSDSNIFCSTIKNRKAVASLSYKCASLFQGM